MTTTKLVIPAPDDEPGWKVFLGAIGTEERDGFSDLSNAHGEGSVKMLKIGLGVYLRIWHISVSRNAHFIKYKWGKSSIALSLLYVLNPEFFFFRQSGYSLQLNKPDSPVMLLIPPSATTVFELAPYHNVHLMEICVTYDFFQNWKQGLCLLPTGNQAPIIRLKMCSLMVTEQLNDLSKKAFTLTAGNGEINDLTHLLITTFLSDFTKAPLRTNPSDRIPGIARIYALEEQVIGNLRNTLPPIRTLAQQAGMSETLLKRHFKTVFGRGIYQYYLYRKMQLAKSILEENSITVNSLAEEMGYQKVSHFIAQFKKQHGCAPGEMIRQKKGS